MGWVWVGWDLCAGLFYEHRFAMLIRDPNLLKEILAALVKAKKAKKPSHDVPKETEAEARGEGGKEDTSEKTPEKEFEVIPKVVSSPLAQRPKNSF